MHSRRKIPGTILASCLAAGVLVLILFHESSHRPILMGPGAEVPSRTLPESQTPVSGPTGYGGRSTGGAIGLEGVGPFTQDPTYAPDGTAIAWVLLGWETAMAKKTAITINKGTRSFFMPSC